MSAPVEVYADGGVIGHNPSSRGGTWAWCWVDADGRRIREESGILPPVHGPVTNNLSEFVAAVRALEDLPDGWAGRLCLDSQITLGRLCQGWALKGLPLEWVKRGSTALARLGTLEPVLLQGHPTKAELLRGVGARGGCPVSEHNVWCDRACGEVAARAQRGVGAAVSHSAVKSIAFTKEETT